MLRLGIICSLFLPLVASAYLPPAFYLYTEVAAKRGKGTVQGATFTVSRPLPTGGEEVIGGLTLPGPIAGASTWPTLSLLFQNDEAGLTEAVRGFGLGIPAEKDLLRASREQAAAMKEPPRPFYKTDPTMSLKRFNKTYAWVHADKDGSRSVWVEKDTFLPLRIEGPCPAVELSWAKPGENRCSVEFRNVYALRRGNATGARITFMKDGNPVMFFSFDRLTAATAGAPAVSADAKYPEEIKALAAVLFH